MSDERFASENDVLLLKKLDQIAGQFESVFSVEEERPRIEDVLSANPDLPRERLLRELVQLEMELRRRAGEAVTAEEYLKRFPDLDRSWLDEQIGKFVTGTGSDETRSIRQSSEESREGGGPATLSLGGQASPSSFPAEQLSFGDYEIIEEIARGGMGVVYKARQKSLNRNVALKMILSGQLAGLEELQRFQSEAEAAANLDHPGIVPVYEIGQHDGRSYFSMGFVDGQSLQAQAIDGPMPPKEAALMVGKIAEAIAYAHDKGVIHRDLKPGNVLIDADGEPRVTDFGLAKQLQADSDLTGTNQILGSPSWMPPEQASGQTAKVDERADVYALGAILYFLTTGRPPFQAATVTDTILQVLQQEPVPPRQLDPKIPQDIETIALKCLEKDPAKRYPSSRELIDELNRFIGGEPIDARPVGRFERVSRWCKRKPLAAATILLALALLLVFAIGGPIIAIHQNLAAETQKQLTEEAQRQTSEAQRNSRNARFWQVASLAESRPQDAAALLWDETEFPTTERNLTWGLLNRFTSRSTKVLGEMPDMAILLAISPNSKLVACADATGTIKVFDIESRQLAASLQEPQVKQTFLSRRGNDYSKEANVEGSIRVSRLSFSANSRFLIVDQALPRMSDDDGSFIGYRDFELHIFDLKNQGQGQNLGSAWLELEHDNTLVYTKGKELIFHSLVDDQFNAIASPGRRGWGRGQSSSIIEDRRLIWVGNNSVYEISDWFDGCEMTKLLADGQPIDLQSEELRYLSPDGRELILLTPDSHAQNASASNPVQVGRFINLVDQRVFPIYSGDSGFTRGKVFSGGQPKWSNDKIQLNQFVISFDTDRYEVREEPSRLDDKTTTSNLRSLTKRQLANGFTLRTYHNKNDGTSDPIKKRSKIKVELYNQQGNLVVESEYLAQWYLQTIELDKFGGTSYRGHEIYDRGCVDISSDYRWLATAEADTTVRLFDLQRTPYEWTKKFLDNRGLKDLRFSGDGSYLTLLTDRAEVVVVDTARAREIRRDKIDIDPEYYEVQFSTNGKFILVCPRGYNEHVGPSYRLGDSFVWSALEGKKLEIVDGDWQNSSFAKSQLDYWAWGHRQISHDGGFIFDQFKKRLYSITKQEWFDIDTDGNLVSAITLSGDKLLTLSNNDDDWSFQFWDLEFQKREREVVLTSEQFATAKLKEGNNPKLVEQWLKQELKPRLLAYDEERDVIVYASGVALGIYLDSKTVFRYEGQSVTRDDQFISIDEVGKKIRLVVNGQVIRESEFNYFSNFSPLLFYNASGLVTLNSDGSLSFWDPISGQEQGRFRTDIKFPIRIAATMSGAHIAVANDLGEVSYFRYSFEEPNLTVGPNANTTTDQGKKNMNCISLILILLLGGLVQETAVQTSSEPEIEPGRYSLVMGGDPSKVLFVVHLDTKTGVCKVKAYGGSISDWDQSAEWEELKPPLALAEKEMKVGRFEAVISPSTDRPLGRLFLTDTHTGIVYSGSAFQKTGWNPMPNSIEVSGSQLQGVTSFPCIV